MDDLSNSGPAVQLHGEGRATGPLAGVLSAAPMVSVLGCYALRFSVRALDLTLDPSLVWVGIALAMVAAVFLAFVPRLPYMDPSRGFGLSSSGVRVTSDSNRRLRIFAAMQITASFLLLAGAGALIKTLLALEKTQSLFDTAHVLAINPPVMTHVRTDEQVHRIVGIVANFDDESDSLADHDDLPTV